MTRYFPLASLIAVMLALTPTGPLRADEQTRTYQLFGLSHPEREPDLQKVLESLPAITEYKVDQKKAEIALRFEPLDLYPPTEHARLQRKLPLPDDMVRQRLSDLLRQASRGTFDVMERNTTPDEELTRIEIPVNPLDCKACRFAIYSIVAQTPGVARAAVSTEPSAVTAWIDSTRTSRDALIEALTQRRVPLP